MSTAVQSVIDFLSSRATNAPLSSADLSSLVGQLRAQISQLSVKVPNAAADAITVLYSGLMSDGTTHSGAVAQALADANPGKVLTLNQTELYSLLDTNNVDFHIALKNAL